MSEDGPTDVALTILRVLLPVSQPAHRNPWVTPNTPQSSEPLKSVEKVDDQISEDIDNTAFHFKTKDVVGNNMLDHSNGATQATGFLSPIPQ